jgi:hypothetical protein
MQFFSPWIKDIEGRSPATSDDAKISPNYLLSEGKLEILTEKSTESH